MVGTNWRFLRPVKPGMTVHAVWRLGRLREVSNARWGLAVWQVELDDQNEERVLEGEVTVLVNRRQVAAPAATRSRRRRRGKALPTAPGLTAEANLPEPAPADSPAPARRGRRPATAPLAPATPVAAGEPPVADAVSSTEVGAASPASATTTSSAAPPAPAGRWRRHSGHRRQRKRHRRRPGPAGRGARRGRSRAGAGRAGAQPMGRPGSRQTDRQQPGEPRPWSAAPEPF